MSGLLPLEELHYCLNCKDEKSGKVGNFAYDASLMCMGHGLFAISPVFDSVDEFYMWAKNQGFIFHSLKHTFVMVRDFPRGSNIR